MQFRLHNIRKHTQISQLGLLHKKDFTANIYVFRLLQNNTPNAVTGPLLS